MKNYRLLYVSSDGKELSFRWGYIYYGNEKILCLLESWLKRILSRVRFFNRLFRLEPRCATFVNEDVALVAFNHYVFVVSIKDKLELARFRVKKNILSFCSLKKYESEEVYWGDYGDETNDGKININRFSISNGFQRCYSFKKGDIKHIHNIIYDKYNDRFYILTGDFEEKIGIYIASRDFSAVTPLAIGEQKYRAVIGLPLPNGFLYATDAVMEENYIYYYSTDNKQLEKIESINGSVIYGVAVNDGLLLSTTVEPYPSSRSRMKSMLDTRLGLGIKSKDVHVLFISKELLVSKIASYRKDCHFMKLMQYGQVFFPEYEDTSVNVVKANPMAVKRYDGKLVEFVLPS